MYFYETQSGDMWDMIAKQVYGNEKYAGFLMQNNPMLLGTVIFSAGTYVYVPELKMEDEDYPEWRD